MTPSCLHVATFETPCGPFSIAVNDAGAVVATAFGDLDCLRPRLTYACKFSTVPTRETIAVRAEITAYFAGKIRSFSVLLAAQGTIFQHRVWAALATIPYGETRSYGQIAAALGQPGAARAIGRANATNPICLLVPCHRVIGADGSLTGFAFGEIIKRQLLTHEGSM